MNDSLRTQLLKLVAILAVIFGVVVGILRWQFVDVIGVANDSMAPTVFAGDEVFVWRTHEFDHGDVVVCQHPRTPGTYVMGRVIGRPGMSIHIERGQLHINNQRVSQNFSGEFQLADASGHQQRYHWGYEELGEINHLVMHRPDRPQTMRPVERVGGLFLMSDNRTPPADDGRTYGPIQPQNCIGHVFMRGTSSGRAPEGISGGMLDILR